MPNWSRLILPVGFGLLAAAVNWVAMSRHVQPDDFVVLKHDIPVGSVILEEHIMPLSSNFQVNKLAEVVVPWKQRYLALGRIATRNMTAGEPLLVREFDPNKLDFRSIDREEGNLLLTFVTKENYLQHKDLVPGEHIRIRLNQNGDERDLEIPSLYLMHISRMGQEVSLSVFVRGDSPNLTQLGVALARQDRGDTVIKGIYRAKD